MRRSKLVSYQSRLQKDRLRTWVRVPFPSLGSTKHYGIGTNLQPTRYPNGLHRLSRPISVRIILRLPRTGPKPYPRTPTPRQVSLPLGRAICTEPARQVRRAPTHRPTPRSRSPSNPRPRVASDGQQDPRVRSQGPGDYCTMVGDERWITNNRGLVKYKGRCGVLWTVGFWTVPVDLVQPIIRPASAYPIAAPRPHLLRALLLIFSPPVPAHHFFPS